MGCVTQRIQCYLPGKQDAPPHLNCVSIFLQEMHWCIQHVCVGLCAAGDKSKYAIKQLIERGRKKGSAMLYAAVHAGPG